MCILKYLFIKDCSNEEEEVRVADLGHDFPPQVNISCTKECPWLRHPMLLIPTHQTDSQVSVGGIQLPVKTWTVLAVVSVSNLCCLKLSN